MKNPFILGHIIHRPYFCDREIEQKRLEEAITNGRNVVLISPRRMGKSSLVHLVINEAYEIKEDYITFFFDILQTNTLSEFAYLLGKAVFEKLASRNRMILKIFLAVVKSLKGNLGFDPISGTPSFNLQLGEIKNPEFLLEEIFEFLRKSEKKVLMVIDEFQQITKYPEQNAEAILRTHMQNLANATFIFAGSERTILQDMFVAYNRPFYNSSEIMHLGAIPEELYIQFAQKLFMENERKIDKEAIHWVYTLFEGNTYYLQRAMNGAFSDTNKGCECHKGNVENIVKSMLSGNGPIYREILSNINQSQKATLIAIAKENKVDSPTSGAFIKRNSLASASSVQNALKKLTQTGIITRDGHQYAVTDPLFRIFINELYSLPEF